MIDPACLEALAALEDHGTVAAAAQALGYTPSAVSQRLKRLESQVGVAVATPEGRNLVLTEAGRSLVSQGRDLLNRWADLEREAGLAAGAPSGTLRIGGFPTSVRGLLVPALERLRDEAPELRPQVHEIDPDPGIDAVHRGRLDASVIHGWQGMAVSVPEGLHPDPLGTDRADVLLPADHRLASARSVAPADLADETWTIQPPGTICHRWFLHMYAGRGRAPRRLWEVEEYQTQIELVRHLGAVALVPRLGTGGRHEGVVRVPVTDPVPMRLVALVVRRGLHGTTTHDVLLTCLRAAALEQLGEPVR